MSKKIEDINGKELRDGHIVAVRYVWNSYVGVFRKVNHIKSLDKGILNMWEGHKRHWGAVEYHSYSEKATYQIIGHVDKSDQDYREDVFNWFTHETHEKCPVEIRVYEKHNPSTTTQ